MCRIGATRGATGAAARTTGKGKGSGWRLLSWERAPPPPPPPEIDPFEQNYENITTTTTGGSHNISILPSRDKSRNGNQSPHPLHPPTSLHPHPFASPSPSPSLACLISPYAIARTFDTEKGGAPDTGQAGQVCLPNHPQWSRNTPGKMSSACFVLLWYSKPDFFSV